MYAQTTQATVTIYPESDGKPMAETDIHRNLLADLVFTLDNHFRHQPDVYVSGNLLVYYVEGNPAKCFAPDVFVVRGVPKNQRRIYKL
ncbi:MAG TPA: Uma2 family endonuclease, partial [Blastocatellia bacterium]|nr:Uma2 family endonuclease [Blastocatellia bacterium]